MSRRSLLSASLMVCLVITGWTLVGLATSQGQDKQPVKYRGFLYPKWKELGLSEDQRQEIYRIQTENKTKILELEKQIDALKREERNKALQVLTPAQQSKLRKLLLGEADLPEPTTPPAKDKPVDPSKDKPASKDK